MSLSKMDDAVNGFFSGVATSVGFFRTNIVEYGNRYELTCEVPGVGKENLTVEIENDKLSIVANIEEPKFTEEKYLMPLHERVSGTLRRNYKLPYVDATQVTASYKDGVLYLTLPKMSQKHSANVQIM